MTIIIQQQFSGWIVIFKIGGVETVYGAPDKDDIMDIIKWRTEQWIKTSQ